MNIAFLFETLNAQARGPTQQPIELLVRILLRATPMSTPSITSPYSKYFHMNATFPSPQTVEKIFPYFQGLELLVSDSGFPSWISSCRRPRSWSVTLVMERKALNEAFFSWESLPGRGLGSLAADLS